MCVCFSFSRLILESELSTDDETPYTYSTIYHNNLFCVSVCLYFCSNFQNSYLCVCYVLLQARFESSGILFNRIKIYLVNIEKYSENLCDISLSFFCSFPFFTLHVINVI